MTRFESLCTSEHGAHGDAGNRAQRAGHGRLQFGLTQRFCALRCRTYRHSAYSLHAAMTTTPNATAQLPLRPLDVLILTMLAGGDRHGYGIRQDVFDHSGGQIELEVGSLYRTIRRLEDERFVEAGAPARGDDDPRRIYYRLTPWGRRVLSAEMRRLRDLVRLAESRRIIAPVRA